MPATMSIAYPTFGGRVVREVRDSVIARYVADPECCSNEKLCRFGDLFNRVLAVWRNESNRPVVIPPLGFCCTLGYYADLASRKTLSPNLSSMDEC